MWFLRRTPLRRLHRMTPRWDCVGSTSNYLLRLFVVRGGVFVALNEQPCQLHAQFIFHDLRKKGGEIMITVKNIHGTGDSKGDWLEKWKAANGYRPSDSVHCCVQGCPYRATDGAHVMKDGSGKRQFIVPMCHSHNLKYDIELLVYNWANPMPVVP